MAEEEESAPRVFKKPKQKVVKPASGKPSNSVHRISDLEPRQALLDMKEKLGLSNVGNGRAEYMGQQVKGVEKWFVGVSSLPSYGLAVKDVVGGMSSLIW